jgi:hypothetical protein
MEWVKWAIPLIVVSVWILANLARIPREQPRLPPRRPQPPEGDEPPVRPRQPITDVDQFLAEVQRRRRQAPPEQPPPSPPPEWRPPERRRISPTDVPVETRTPPLAVVPVDVPIPVLPVAEVLPVEARPRPQPPESMRRAAPEVRPGPPSRRLVDNTEFPGLAPDAAQPTLAPTAPVGSAQVVARAPLTQSATEVMAMLRDPRSIRVAFLLREILEPPLCRRGPRRFDRPA